MNVTYHICHYVIYYYFPMENLVESLRIYKVSWTCLNYSKIPWPSPCFTIILMFLATNSNWIEIQEILFPGQTIVDRPNIVQFFKIKMMCSNTTHFWTIVVWHKCCLHLCFKLLKDNILLYTFLGISYAM